MKRSEMVEKIKYELFSSHPITLGDVNNMAESILELVEGWGMQPPQYFDIDYYDEPDCDGMISEWEPE